MSATFSWETKDLLDRADRAIEHSMELRKESARALTEARRWMRYVEVNLYWENAPGHSTKRGARRRWWPSGRTLLRATPHERGL